MEKIWKTIPGFSRYKASSNGEIYTPNWKGGKTGKIMKPAPDPFGYLRTVLVDDNGKNTTVKVHRIIAQTFIPNENDLKEVNHLNGNKSDNRVENLEWVSRKQNMIHAFQNGLQNNRGINNPISKLTEQDVIEIRAKFMPRIYGRKELAMEYNVKESTIKDVILRKSWSHIQ